MMHLNGRACFIRLPQGCDPYREGRMMPKSPARAPVFMRGALPSESDSIEHTQERRVAPDLPDSRMPSADMKFFRKWYWQVGIEIGLVYLAAYLFLGTAGFLKVLLAPLPLLAGLWTVHWVTKDRPDKPPHGKNRCQNCGYSLKGLNELRCPKCGEKI